MADGANIEADGDVFADRFWRGEGFTWDRVVYGSINVAGSAVEDEDWFELPLISGHDYRITIWNPDGGPVEVEAADVVADARRYSVETHRYTVDGVSYTTIRTYTNTYTDYISGAAFFGNNTTEVLTFRGPNTSSYDAYDLFFGLVGEVATDYAFLVEDLTDDFTAGRSQAGWLPPGFGKQGSLETTGDVDWFRMPVQAAEGETGRYVVRLTGDFGDDLPLPGEGLIRLVNGSGAAVAGDMLYYATYVQSARVLREYSFDPGVSYYKFITNAVYIVFEPPADGTYFVEVSHPAGEAPFDYRLDVVEDLDDQPAPPAPEDYWEDDRAPGPDEGAGALSGPDDRDFMLFEAPREHGFASDPHRYVLELRGDGPTPAALGDLEVSLTAAKSLLRKVHSELLGTYYTDYTEHATISAYSHYNRFDGEAVRQFFFDWPLETAPTGEFVLDALIGLTVSGEAPTDDTDLHALGGYRWSMIGIEDPEAADARSDPAEIVAGEAGEQTGGFDFSGDEDWFRLRTTAGQAYRLVVEGDGGPLALALAMVQERVYTGPSYDLSYYFNALDQFSDYQHPTGYAIQDGAVFSFTDTDATRPKYLLLKGLPSDYRLRLDLLGDDFGHSDFEAGAFADGAAEGTNETVFDRDWIRIDATTGQVHDLTLIATEPGSDTRLPMSGDAADYLTLVDASGAALDAEIWLEPGADGPQARLRFGVNVDGPVFAQVTVGTAVGGPADWRLTQATTPVDDLPYAPSTPAAIGDGESVSGAIDFAGDRDSVEFVVTETANLKLRLYGDGPTPLDLDDAGLLLHVTAVSAPGAFAGTYDFGTTPGSFLGQDYLDLSFSAGSPSGAVFTYFASVTGDLPGGWRLVFDEYASDPDPSGRSLPTGSYRFATKDVTGLSRLDFDGDADVIRLDVDRVDQWRLSVSGTGETPASLTEIGVFRRGEGGVGYGFETLAQVVSFDGFGSDVLLFDVDEIGPGTEYFVDLRGLTGDYELLLENTDDHPDAPDEFGAGGIVLPVGNTVPGELEADDDIDLFALEIEAGRTYQVKLERPDGAPFPEDAPFRPLALLREAYGGVYSFGDAHRRFAHESRTDPGPVSRITEQYMTFMSPVADGMFLSVGSDLFGAPFDYRLSLVDVTSPDDLSDSVAVDLAGAGAMDARDAPARMTSRIDFAGDRDWFDIRVEAGSEYKLTVVGDGSDPFDVTTIQPEMQRAVRRPDASPESVTDLFATMLTGTYADGRVYVQTTVHAGYFATGTEVDLRFAVAAGSDALGGYEVLVEEIFDSAATFPGADPDGMEQVDPDVAFAGRFDALGDTDFFFLDDVTPGETYRVMLLSDDPGVLDGMEAALYGRTNALGGSYNFGAYSFESYDVAGGRALLFDAPAPGGANAAVLQLNGRRQGDFTLLLEAAPDPTAVDDVFHLAPTGGTFSGNVIAGGAMGPDVDALDRPLSVTGIVGHPGMVGQSFDLPDGGRVRINADGQFWFVRGDDFEDLAKGESRTVGVEYQIGNGAGGFDTARLDFVLTPPNAAPEARDDAFATNPTATFSRNLLADNGAGADGDPDGDALRILSVNGRRDMVGQLVLLPEGGKLRLKADGQFWFVPDGDFDDVAPAESRAVSFAYEVSDGFGGVDAATATLVVTAPNTPPVARDDAFATNRTATYSSSVLADNGAGEDVDPDGHAISVTSFEGAAGNVGQRLDLAGGGAVRLLASGQFWFVPDGDFDDLLPGQSRATSFVYGISDGKGGTDAATATITVSVPNAAPVAQDDDVAAGPTATISKNVLADNGHGADVDPDGHPVSVVAFEGAAANVGERLDLAGGGAARLRADGTFWFVPDGDFDDLQFGETRVTGFTYRAGDPYGGSDEAVVRITVTGTNRAPDARDDAFAANPTATFSKNVLADNGFGPDSDPDGDKLTVSAVEGAAGHVDQRIDLAGGGAVRLKADGQFWFVPDGDFDDLQAGESRAVSFAYAVSDGRGGTDTAAATVVVTGTNRAPVAADDAFATNAVATYSKNVLTNALGGADSDPDGDPLSVVSLNGSGANVDQLVDLVGGGAVRLKADGQFWFKPDGDFDDLGLGESRQTAFSYGISDGRGGTDTATVTLTVSAPNQPPTAQDDLVTTNATATFSASVLTDHGNGPDTDPEGAALSVSSFEGAAGNVGQLVNLAGGGQVRLLSSGQFWFKPDGDFDDLLPGQSRQTGFAYAVTDGQGGTDAATVTVTVAVPNAAPVAQDDEFRLDYGAGTQAGSLFADHGSGPDADPDGHAIQVIAVNGDGGLIDEGFDVTGGGRARVLADGRFWFVPGDDFDALAPGAQAEASFSYRISDGFGGEDDALVRFLVDGPIEPP
ncbi:MAG: Ig-like domain-containing protein [Pseudomonadota bacterium]|nr:Ig-like domain-containing protein [Pseudomonadota bacterium]